MLLFIGKMMIQKIIYHLFQLQVLQEKEFQISLPWLLIHALQMKQSHKESKSKKISLNALLWK
jgi:hypothetical protein